MESQKTIFITVSEGSIARNILRSFVLERLLAVPDLRILLLVLEEKAERYRSEFASPRVSVYSFSPRPQSFLDRIIFFLGRNGLCTDTVLTDQRTYAVESGKWISFVCKRVFTLTLGRLSLFHSCVRLIARVRPPTAEMRTLFQKEKPDLLFSTDVQDELDIDAMRAARRERVRIVSMVRSWDNLTSHHLIQIVPDTLVVWSSYIKEKAVRLHGIPARRVVITGIPHFDWYRREGILTTRAAFLEPYGISPEEKVILFAGIGDFLAPHEAEVVHILSDAIRDGALPKNTRVLFRPHPNFLVAREEIKELPHVVFDDAVAHYTGALRSTWEMDTEKIAHLANSLAHADVVVTTASTMAMDAAAFDKPIVCVAFDGLSTEGYWHSVRRYYEVYTHFQLITKTQGFAVAYNPKELIDAILSYFRDPERDGAGRQRICNEFIGPLDGHAGERVANVIIDALRK